MLIGLAVCRAAFTLAVGAWAALWATVAAGVIPRLLRSFTVIAARTEKGQQHTNLFIRVAAKNAPNHWLSSQLFSWLIHYSFHLKKKKKKCQKNSKKGDIFKTLT